MTDPQATVASASFQTRARTIDHLGRGQIADTPTAVSELWKNAFDAYASNVALHVFDGVKPVAAVMDDGCGMSSEDLCERWLVIGTESKIIDSNLVPRGTFGLKPRERQGEKGIGRLSAAFLAPIALLVTKRQDAKFAAVLVDWRLFENPFLLIEDIRLPVLTLDDVHRLPDVLQQMVDVLKSNLPNDEELEDGKSDRIVRLGLGWRRFAAYERSYGALKTTDEACRMDLAGKLPLEERHLEEWLVYSGLGDHGTALFLIGVHHELAQWVQGGNAEDDERVLVRENLRRTLAGFVDPFSADAPDMSYEVLLHFEKRSSRLLSSTDVFGAEDLFSLEHVIDGEFYADGSFKGRVTAFGRDLGIQEYRPVRRVPLRGRDYVGAFRFSIGTFEQMEASSTHIDERFKFLKEQSERFAGLAVYRDGLRVMPYGRPESDFFKLEERRGRHAGRYFFAHRRVFGRVALTRSENPNLRDKAGREGLVENRARREMQLLVIELLVVFAQRFFGSDAPMRKEYLAETEMRNKAAREAADKMRTSQKASLRTFIKTAAKDMLSTRVRMDAIKSRIPDVEAASDSDRLAGLNSEMQDIAGSLEDLKPPPPPRKLGNLEEAYREYRDGFGALAHDFEGLRGELIRLDALIGGAEPQGVAIRRLQDNAAAVAALLDRWSGALSSRIESLRVEWKRDLHADAGRYAEVAEQFLQPEPTTRTLISVLNLLDARRAEFESQLRARYEGLVRALDRLQEGVDLEGALSVIDDDRAELEDRLREINQVAQLGIAVEIIGHELETLDAEVRSNLRKLPADVRASRAFKLAYEAHSALTDKLKFLAPLKIAGYRNRETITGAEIADYVRVFFERRLLDSRVSFEATKAFESISFSDLRSRIYPVFVNLVNNALYWLSFETDRRILFDFVNGLTVVADSGRGVDEDDVRRLFTLFFTRRTKGRGIGLYLCRANLAVARHRIRYATAEDPHLLPGANFIIEFNGVNE